MTAGRRRIESSVPSEDPPSGGGAARRRYLAAALLGGLTVLLFAHNVAALYFTIDDAFISFRYARNLIDGLGLVFNPGERVEGYTNFLWVILMAGVMKAGLPAEILANVLGIASGAVLLFLVARAGAAAGSWADPWIWIAPLALAANRTFCAWCTGGLETQFFSLLVFAAFLRFLAERETGAGRPWLSALLFSLAALTRPEGMIFFGVAGIFFAADWLVLRKRPFGPLALWSGVFALIVGAHVAWRYAYYGYLLPNTFYAKVSGFWFDQAAAYMSYFLGDHLLYWTAPLPFLLLLRRRDFGTALFVAVLAAHALYIFYVGGGHFEFRLMTFALPFLFLVLQDSVRAVAAWLHEIGAGRRTAAAAGTVLALLVVAGAYYPHRLNYRDARRGVTRLESTVRYAERRAEEGRFLRTLVERGYLKGDELLAVTGAGALPYYSGLPVIDFFGLNDAFIAHQEIRKRGRVAHEKAAPFGYLVERGVVIFDVQNRIVLPPGAEPPHRRHVDRKWVYSGPVRCVEAEGRYLLFATTLGEEAFRERFARFRILY